MLKQHGYVRGLGAYHIESDGTVWVKTPAIRKFRRALGAEADAVSGQLLGAR